LAPNPFFIKFMRELKRRARGFKDSFREFLVIINICIAPTQETVDVCGRIGEIGVKQDKE
jgi:hypothetical protein